MKRTARYSDVIPAAVIDALHDETRLSPIVAGPGWLRGNTLTLRLPQGELSIQAPARLLQRALTDCDGSTAWQTLIERTPEAHRDEFDRFLRFMMSEGALIDAIRLTTLASAYGHQTTTVGYSAPAALTDAIAQRFVLGQAPGPATTYTVRDTPLDAFFDTRSSSYVFSAAPVTLDALLALLWSSAGIVSSVHERPGARQPRRTLASAGAMHLLAWRLVLQRRVGPNSPGVYRVTFPDARAVALDRLSDDIGMLPRVFHKPWQVGASAGVLFALGDTRIAALRYRNRAVQYLFLEAGAAFQNASLTAPRLGLACAQIGGYSDEHAAKLTRAEDHLVLGSLIFGPAPSEHDVQATSRVRPIDFVWSDADHDAYRTPFHIARVRPKELPDDTRNTWGRDPDPRLAYIKAHAEAVERDALLEPRDITVARLDELSHALHPSQIVSYRDAQYRKPDFPHQKLDPKASYHWSPAEPLLGGPRCWMPGQFIYGRQVLSSIPITGGSLMQSNSSGCAAGPTAAAATEAALLEVIERDAFMRHWLTQTPGQALGPRQIPASLRRRLEQLEATGCGVVAQVLHTPAAPLVFVVLVSAQHAQQHFTCVGAGARPTLEASLDAALVELETTVYTRLVGQTFEPLTPQKVRSPADHTLLYAQARYFKRADAVLRPTTPAVIPKHKDRVADVTALAGKLRDTLGEVCTAGPCVVDITPVKCHIDQGRIALHVVKAIAPGMIPMAFGFGLTPEAGVASLHPAARFPHPFP